MHLPFKPEEEDPILWDELDITPDDMSGPDIDEKKIRKAWRARLRRREKIQRVADAAVERWEGLQPFPATPRSSEPEAPVLRSLPLTLGLGVKEDDSALPPPPAEVVFKAGIVHSMWRLLIWLYGGSRFALDVAWDWVCGRNSEKERAKHLREAFERMGTTFVKIGQQLSMRLDLLSYAYTHELEKMLDKVDPFPAAKAIETIERTTGRKLEEIFSAFDKNQIGSASVACVYQAILKSGERVAVKVRRPKIGGRLAADMRALGWLLTIVEELMFTPGFTDNFIMELRTMLMEELDFAREARFADLYRRRMRKTKQFSFVSVPKVYFDLSSDEVLVTEFVSGIWVKEILPALETQDRPALAKLEKMNIDPIILARRIQLIARFNNFENIFFHADLHPANILVQPGNKIVLIDFGSCGSFNRRELNAWRRFFDAQSINDVGGMVQAALAIIEPLPSIDKDEFGQRLEAEFWNDLYAIKSKHSHWADRISSRLWIAFLKLSREFQVPMRLNTLRMIRASMLTDTIAARLDHDQDSYREFRHYEKGAGRRAEKRVFKRLHRLAGPTKFIRIEQGIESGINLLFQLQRTVDSLASIRIGAILAKFAYFLSLLLKELGWAVSTALVLISWKWGYRLAHHYVWKDPASSLYEVSKEVVKGNVWQILAGAPLLLILWRMSFRLKEKEE